jgi:hypothetical protein
VNEQDHVCREGVGLLQLFLSVQRCSHIAATSAAVAFADDTGCLAGCFSSVKQRVRVL